MRSDHLGFPSGLVCALLSGTKAMVWKRVTTQSQSLSPSFPCSWVFPRDGKFRNCCALVIFIAEFIKLPCYYLPILSGWCITDFIAKLWQAEESAPLSQLSHKNASGAVPVPLCPVWNSGLLHSFHLATPFPPHSMSELGKGKWGGEICPVRSCESFFSTSSFVFWKNDILAQILTDFCRVGNIS